MESIYQGKEEIQKVTDKAYSEKKANLDWDKVFSRAASDYTISKIREFIKDYKDLQWAEFDRKYHFPFNDADFEDLLDLWLDWQQRYG